MQHVHDPDGKGLDFIQGEGRAPHGPKRDSANKGEIECWHCSRAHNKNECPKLKTLDTGVQKFNINDCDKEHNLVLTNNGYGLVQKQAKERKLRQHSLPGAPLELKKGTAWAHWPQQCRVVWD